MQHDVVVTGAGAVTALGSDVDTLWNAVRARGAAIRTLQALDPAAYKTRVAAEIDDTVRDAAMADAGVASSGDRTVDFALAAAAQALRAAGAAVPEPGADPLDIGVLAGTGAGCAHTMGDAYARFLEKGPRGLRPTTVPRTMMNAISSTLSMRFRLGGPNYVVVSACTSSTVALGIGYRMIRSGDADAVLCVGTEAPFDPGTFAAWDNLGVMSRNADAAAACRPFDSARDGCVLGEGAAALLLESSARAAARSAPILGRVLGFGESSDTTHITRPSAEGQARALCAALRSAGIEPGGIGFLCAHGTATAANDRTEAESIRRAFGSAADTLPVFSAKSRVGHLLGACGAVETVISLCALRDGFVPGNLNLDAPDPACPLCLPAPEGRAVTAAACVNANFGFGGGNAVLVLGKP
jgi:3-oxoacyl-[acyl-carrier-protein] synthase II